MGLRLLWVAQWRMLPQGYREYKLCIDAFRLGIGTKLNSRNRTAVAEADPNGERCFFGEVDASQQNPAKRVRIAVVGALLCVSAQFLRSNKLSSSQIDVNVSRMRRPFAPNPTTLNAYFNNSHF